jgi:hypothetical protein
LGGVFREIDSEGRAYWLGFLLADGNVAARKDGRFAVSVSQKDPAHLHKLCEFVGSGAVSPRRRGKYLWYVSQWYDSEAAQDLARWNCVPNKSKTLEPPGGVPDDMISHLIRGYNDGDGGVYPARRTIRMRGTVAFLEWVQANLPYKSMVYPKGPTAQLFSCGQNAVNNARWLYSGAEYYMDRKAQAAAELYD